ncbi:MAG: hypothetical protein JXR76_06930 [Deltaproteobacteria bacterium]|nr:hypothetical protein [Deltaproteobacteria bacterium]
MNIIQIRMRQGLFCVFLSIILSSCDDNDSTPPADTQSDNETDSEQSSDDTVQDSDPSSDTHPTCKTECQKCDVSDEGKVIENCCEGLACHMRQLSYKPNTPNDEVYECMPIETTTDGCAAAYEDLPETCNNTALCCDWTSDFDAVTCRCNCDNQWNCSWDL